MGRCTGACCQQFTILNEQVAKLWDIKSANFPEWEKPEMIRDMLIAIDEPEVILDQVALARKLAEPERYAESSWYRCKHHQPNGDCGVYEDRPPMCSRHGVNYGCNYKDCCLKPTNEFTKS